MCHDTGNCIWHGSFLNGSRSSQSFGLVSVDTGIADDRDSGNGRRRWGNDDIADSRQGIPD
ncbi:hypothetical protein GCM10009691_20610 [Brevibacterium picturae]|uniref:Uncharacterized protein n=1 Tax=Brevibacterium picturae TaxID=260553 RepID=A0ABP4MK82_9MICO